MSETGDTTENANLTTLVRKPDRSTASAVYEGVSAVRLTGPLVARRRAQRTRTINNDRGRYAFIKILFHTDGRASVRVGCKRGLRIFVDL